MSSGSVEDRIIQLEQKVRQLEEVSRPDTNAPPWWERVAGAFKDDPVYAAAMKLGCGNTQGRSSGRTEVCDALNRDQLVRYFRFGACSPMATHNRRTRVSCGRFILSVAIVTWPVSVRPMSSVAPSFHDKCSFHESR